MIIKNNYKCFLSEQNSPRVIYFITCVFSFLYFKIPFSWFEVNNYEHLLQDFYEFACGGYMSKTCLSWNTQRKRSAIEGILDNYHSIAIGR